MKLDPGLVGAGLKPYTTTVTQRRTTNYAAAIHDNNPKYFDDTGAQELVCHPVFPVAVTWPVLSRLDRFITAEDFPMDVLLTQVHYSEHLIFHRPVRPGDQLTLDGRLKAFVPHRAGTHAVIGIDACDETGAPVFTEYTGAMMRGVDCGKGAADGDLPEIPVSSRGADGIREPVWTSDVHIDPLMPFVYDGCADIEFPIHTSVQFANAVGLPGIILQGTATLALAVREIVNREADRDPQKVSEVACHFAGMVLPDTSIRVVCTDRIDHQRHTDIFFTVFNDQNQKAVRNGYVKIRKDES